MINYKTAGRFRIQHNDMDRYVVAECKLENNRVMAIFHHNSEQPTFVHDYEAPGSYRYHLSNLMIIALLHLHIVYGVQQLMGAKCNESLNNVFFQILQIR